MLGKGVFLFIKKFFRIITLNFTYTFVFAAFLLVSYVNYLENTGRADLFNFAYTKSEILKATNTRASVISIKDSNYDSLVFDQSELQPKGGPSDIEFADISTTGDDSMAPVLPALTTYASQNQRNEILTYTVKKGDTVSQIAAEFGITINTVLWANNLKATSYIKEGQKLKILPVTGIQHDVKKGDTVLAIAKKYKAKASDIIAYNKLPADGSLQVGETLIIPDGEKPRTYMPKRRTYAKAYSKSTVNSSKYYIFPVKGRKTQGIHGYNAVDIANRCGTPIYAAADGVVTSAKTTRSRARLGASVFGGYGNHVRIKHPNGTLTLYAHMKDVFVRTGQFVKQGEQIGTVGGGFEYINGRLYRMRGAGKSTGCHLHFEVRGAQNPMAKYWRF